MPRTGKAIRAAARAEPVGTSRSINKARASRFTSAPPDARWSRTRWSAKRVERPAAPRTADVGHELIAVHTGDFQAPLARTGGTQGLALPTCSERDAQPRGRGGASDMTPRSGP